MIGLDYFRDGFFWRIAFANHASIVKCSFCAFDCVVISFVPESFVDVVLGALLK